MKKLRGIILLTIVVALLSINVNAQWYINSFGVTNMNELNQDQLNIGLEQSLKTVKAGKVLTFVGLGAAIIGGIVYAQGVDEIVQADSYGQISSGTDKGVGGIGLVYGGLLATSIGIPVWIVGSQRKNQITMHLGKYNTTYIPSIGIKLKL